MSKEAEKLLNAKIKTLTELGKEVSREIIKNGKIIFIYECSFEDEKMKITKQIFKVKVRENVVRVMRRTKDDILKKKKKVAPKNVVAKKVESMDSKKQAEESK